MKIYCPHCGQYYDLDESYFGKNVECAQCGKTFAINTDNNPMVCCPYCGGELQPGVKKCRHCGEWLNPKDKPKSPVIYCVLAFFFGMLGIHNFYSGANGKGWIKLIMLFGAFPVGIIIGIPFSLLSTSMVGCGAFVLFIAPFLWLASAIWCIVEMFHCNEEIANGVVENSPSIKRILKCGKIIFAVGIAIFLIVIVIVNCIK